VLQAAARDTRGAPGGGPSEHLLCAAAHANDHQPHGRCDEVRDVAPNGHLALERNAERTAGELLTQELKARTPRNWGQSLDDCIRYVSVLLRDWLGYFGICDEQHLARLGRIDGHLRRRLRAIILRQWKRKRHMVTRLSHMGVPPRLARVDIYVKRRSWWALSEARAVNRGLTNEYFDRRGLFSLRDNWRKHHERIWDIGPEQLLLLKRKLG
jgi:hypothetical protein